MRPQAQITLLSHSLHELLRPSVVLACLLPPQVCSDLVRRDELLILIDNRATKGTFLDNHGRERESGPDLNKINVCVLGGSTALGRGLLCLSILSYLSLGLGLVNLVISDPDLAVRNGECHNMVDKGLAFPGTLRNSKGLQEHLLDDLEVGLLVECGIE